MRVNEFKNGYITLLVVSLIILGWVKIGVAATSNERQSFQKIFADWTRAFNNSELATSCNLFSIKIVADYKGIPRKNYASICDGFKKIFADTSHQYHYTFRLHEIYQSGFLAAVRITWYLKITNKNGKVVRVQDEGLDVLERDSKGEWKIVNYLSYSNGEPKA